ncbi:hypothetical protein QYM36_007403 [Artemia franciscana]|uniref:Signal peptidase complex catalytic subunit SEC11 n=1 Tax=Artemia franciscana TaxID=6661 RepID=A0AA88HSR5_ARTSF|nr:hypothetical protein QYM36_007403 [Artemia franciscana]
MDIQKMYEDLKKLNKRQKSKSGLAKSLKIEGREIPIVHRVIKVHERENGTAKFLTKGDNNNVDDRGLYAPGQVWLQRGDVVGRVKGFLPFVGIFSVVMNEYLKPKYIVLAGPGVYFLLHRE